MELNILELDRRTNHDKYIPSPQLKSKLIVLLLFVFNTV